MDQLVKAAKPTGYQVEEDNCRPSQDVVLATAERTRLALERITNNKLAAANPKTVNGGGAKAGPTYFRYTPGQQVGSSKVGANQRIVKVVDMPTDPMEPPRFKHKKVPNGPPSPPSAVLHSPPRKVTAEEQKNWVIPPCISNWKNSKGYTIPLDKRLAADGRGLQDVQINNNFAALSEALFAAERHSREEIKTRNLYLSKVAEKSKLQKEEAMLLTAKKAREARSNLVATNIGESSDEEVDEEDAEELKAREAIRREREKEREREHRLSRMGNDQRAKYLSRQEGRDVGEKVALGLAKPTLAKDSMFDARLFNQTSGLGSGFADADSYNLYDKSLFNGSSANAIYRPKKSYGEDMDEEAALANIEGSDRFATAFKPKAFQGAESSESNNGPVQFTKASTVDIDGDIDLFLGEIKKAAIPQYGSNRATTNRDRSRSPIREPRGSRNDRDSKSSSYRRRERSSSSEPDNRRSRRNRDRN